MKNALSFVESLFRSSSGIPGSIRRKNKNKASKLVSYKAKNRFLYSHVKHNNGHKTHNNRSEPITSEDDICHTGVRSKNSVHIFC